MSQGPLSRVFSGVAMKRLSAVEADRGVSNQHEYNGTVALRRLFGDADRAAIPTKFLWIGDADETLSEEGFLTWYDARRAHPTRSEYRLYFRGTSVSDRAAPNDTLFIAMRPDGSAMVVVTPAGSTRQSQLIWLFGLPDQPDFVFAVAEQGSRAAGYVEDLILEALGIERDETEPDAVEALIARFQGVFPTTRILSGLARQSAGVLSAVDDPDGALIAWMEQEERLFRALEKHVVKERLAVGFAEDVDGFLSFSLSVQNRRKSRAGFALGNHVEAILAANKVGFVREATTEKRNGPDFLFPSELAYHDESFQAAGLKMLAVKTTCKDRWRQVMAEADRISPKHLLTLEPSISTTQTAEMQSASIQLVLPKAIVPTFTKAQQGWVMTFQQFIDLVR